MNTVLRLMQATLFTLLFFHGLDLSDPDTGDVLLRSIAVLLSLAFCWSVDARCMGREVPLSTRFKASGPSST